MNKTSENPRKALGRGLATLLGSHPADARPSPLSAKQAIAEVPIQSIDPNPLQPRGIFQPDRLQELAQSITANGVLQPLLVRRKQDRFELVAGERRWRAARIAGLKTIPVVIQEFADDRILEISLIENIQREDLNPIEIAQAFDKLARDHHLSHDEIGARTGKGRATVTNMLRLLKLPADVQILLAEHRLSMGHARAILGLPTPELQRQLAEKTVSQGLSVRQVERTVQKISESREPKPLDGPEPDANVRAAIEDLQRTLGTKVRLVAKSEGRGRIEIEYYSQEDLNRIYSIIVGES